MKRHDASQRLARIIAALFLILACAFLGAAIGLMSVRLFMPEATMGWDGIADALGGLMVGVGLGLLAGAYLVHGLSVRARRWSAAIATLLAVGTLWSLALTSN